MLPGRVAYATWTLRSRRLQMDGQCGRLGLNLTVRHRSGEHVRGLALRCAGPPRRTSPSGINGVDPSSWWQTLASNGYQGGAGGGRGYIRDIIVVVGDMRNRQVVGGGKGCEEGK
ncbi:hypothetical protein BHM03_00017154 [Ensete ventricosum]|nr:hypothetical protein BHM03_00017154 [Ensete ventricosum]